MPASSSDLIDAALFTAFSHKSSDEVDGSAAIQNQHFPTVKQALQSNIKIKADHIQKDQLNIGAFHISLKNYGILKVVKKDSSQKSIMAQCKSDDKFDEPRTVLWPAENVILGWRKIFPTGAGMINLGNTCYMNSSLQALFHIPSLANWLLEESTTHIPSCEANVHNASYCSICGMMKTLKQALNRDNSVIKPSHIHSKLKSIGKTLLYGRQEDAHEFIKMLLDHMERSFLSSVRATKLDHRSKETTPLNQIFGGYLRQQVICPLCHYVSTTFSHFQDIVLDIRNVGSVEDALNMYFRKETLDTDNAYKCEKCHKKVPATKRHLIEKAPHVLLLQLKRFTLTGGKITKHVHIQKTIDLSKYVNGVRTSPNGGGSYIYKLVSMVIHIGGSQHGGHYTAVAEASNKTMFEFDDSSVRTISMHSALLRNPYILFYEMVQKPKVIPNVKQVMRQSSEKALLRQSSTDRLSKPMPTSHSATCMSNGMSSSVSEVGEVINRSNYQQKIKSPLATHKERERVSFGMKTNSLNNKTSTDRNRSGCSNFQSLSLSSCKSKTNRQNSSLVPYNSDTDEEPEEDRKSAMMNGHHAKENGHAKIIETKKTIIVKNGNRISKSYINQERVTGPNTSPKTNGKSTPSFLPRTLQVNLSKNNLMKVTNCDSNKLMHENKTNGESNSDLNDEAGERNCESYNGRNNLSSPGNGKKPELEKSYSRDSVLPLKCQSLDRTETTSLKSKDSVDSNRSDKSSRSMKKSFLSLLPCVPSVHSPDLSPDNESNSIANHSNVTPIKTDLRNTKDEPDSCDSDSSSADNIFFKRNRESDDHGPTSPSKKCRPEVRPRSRDNGLVKHGKLTDKDNSYSKNGHCSSSSDYDDVPINNKAIKNDSSRDDANFSMEEKKSRHKRKKKRYLLGNDCSSSQDTDSAAPSIKSRLNPSVTLVQWDKDIDDLAHKKDEPSKLPEYPSSISNYFSKNNSVADELRKAGNYSFGVPVSTWDGASSLLDTETLKARNESLKRTSDDIYNDELDEGRTSKKKMKNYHSSYDQSQERENPFQKYQNTFISNNNTNNSTKSSFSNGRSWDDNNSSVKYKNNGNNFHKNNNFHRSNSWNSNSSRNFYQTTSNHYRSNSFSGAKPWHRKNKDHYRNRERSRPQWR